MGNKSKETCNMLPGFITESLLIKKLLADPFLLETPPFQRPYSWTLEEAGQLLEDFLLAMNEGGNHEGGGPGCYFLGTILLVEANKPDTFKSDTSALRGRPSGGQPRVFEIIDGLQRLLTLTILFCVLRDLDHGQERRLASRLENSISLAGPPQRQRLSLCGPDAVFLQSMVQRPGASADMPSDDQMSEGARRLLNVREHFAAELVAMTEAQRQQLADFVLDKCALAVVVTDNLDCAHRMFTVLNERGRPLARSDIFKADVLGELPKEDHEHYAARWQEAAALLGARFDMLFSHIRAIHGKQNIKIVTGIRKIASDAGGGRAFIDDIMLPMARIYHLILNPSATRDLLVADAATGARIEKSLFYLGWLKGADWMPPAMTWIALNREQPERIAGFLQQLERYSYAMRVLGLGRNKRLQRYNNVLAWINETGTRADLTRSPMRFSRDEQRLIMRNLRNLHRRNQQICKLVLLRLSADMAETVGIEERFDPADFTVEHVLPQKPPAGGQWRKWFPNADLREKSMAGLGNLVLVSKAQNVAAGSGEFAHKLRVYFGNQDQPVAKLTGSLRGLTSWQPEFVRQRNRKLTERLKAIWQIGHRAD